MHTPTIDPARWAPIITSHAPYHYRLGPLTKFVNDKAGTVVITRTLDAYRRNPEWREQPFDRSPR